MTVSNVTATSFQKLALVPKTDFVSPTAARRGIPQVVHLSLCLAHQELTDKAVSHDAYKQVI